MEMKCYHNILRISYKDHVTSEEVRAKIQQAIGPHEDLPIVKRRKLQWYGHVSRSSGLPKTVLQGTVKGGRRKGKQRKRWEDNTREWTGLEFTKTREPQMIPKPKSDPIRAQTVAPHDRMIMRGVRTTTTTCITGTV